MSRESELLKRAYRANLSLFIQRSFSIVDAGTEYSHNWHVDAIAEHLTGCKNREIKRLIINMPPRSLKSVAVTVAFPAWLLGVDPTVKIMASSYSQSLSYKHSQDTRFIMQSDWYKAIFPETLLAKDQNEKGKFMTTARGQRMAVSVGSTATGEGGNFLIMDDPLNPQQAASDVERSNANDWFKQTFSSRLNNPKNDVIILVMQRLHENDVAGMLLAQGGWEHLCLPAVNDKTRTISIGMGKTKEWKAGELLHPDRLSQEVLDEKKKEMGSFAYAGQFLQLPVPEGGGIIKEKDWQHWKGKEPPKTTDIIQIYDTAFTEKTSNDYCARTTWGIFEAENGEENIILLERMNERMEFPELRRKAKESYRAYTKKDGSVPLVLIEEKASGLPLIQEMKLTGMRVRGIKRNANSGDKVSRAHNVTHIFENGRVWVPCNMIEVDGKKTYTPKPWAQEVIDQCSIFPNGTHDDLVDTVVDAVAYLRRRHDVNVDGDRDDTPIVPYDSGKPKRYY